MAVVDGIETIRIREKINAEIALEPTSDDIEEELINNGMGQVINPDIEFIKPNGRIKKGYYIDTYLKDNLDNYLVKAVAKKWDGVVLITGIEGAAKSTNAFSIAKYIDPTFPGERIEEGKTRRKCDRIVFTAQQFMQAIDTAKPGQAIVFDEAVMGFQSQDAGSDVQKMLIKKMVTIRKLRLFIFIVIPSIFLLRRYMAVFRTRALIHYYSPDGLDRGYYKFYSYNTKRKLYIRGIKEFDQNVVKCDFFGRATDTSGFFFEEKDYDAKKDEAIKSITEAPEKKKSEASAKRQQIRNERDVYFMELYDLKKAQMPNMTFDQYATYIHDRYPQIDMSREQPRLMVKNALKFLGLSKSIVPD